MKSRGSQSLSEAARRYFSMCDCVEQFTAYVAPGAVYDLKHETLINDPYRALKDLCGFVGLSASESYYKDSIIIDRPINPAMKWRGRRSCWIL
jgi:hypothetical protein